MEFSPGEVKTAKVPMSNPTAKAFDYSVELYMGTGLTLMASTNFHLEAGESKVISLSVTMPTTLGTYPVYIGVFSDGVFIPPVRQGEDIIIATPAAFTFGDVSVTSRRCSIAAYDHPDVFCVVTNNTPQTLTRTIYAMCYHGAGGTTPDVSQGSSRYIDGQSPSGGIVLTLVPGQSYNIHSPHEYRKPDGDMKCSSPALWSQDCYGFWFEDEYGNRSSIACWGSCQLPENGEPPTKSLGLWVSSLSTLAAPRRTVRLITTHDLDPQEVRSLMTAATAAISLNLNSFHKVLVPNTLVVEQEVNVALCLENNVRIDRCSIMNTIFKDKGTVDLILVKRKSDVASAGLLGRLLQLSIGDACMAVGVSPYSIIFASNDVLINGKKVSGVEVRTSDLYYTGVSFCNLELDAELAEVILRGRVKASDITSVSTELGWPVSEATFSQSLIQAISTRFNLVIWSG